MTVADEPAVAFDIGGTFTDVIFVTGDGRVVARKLLSVLDTVGTSIADLLVELDGERSRSFAHATTICSNALLESTVATTALLTTRGFRDVLEMRNQRRPNIHDVTWERPPSLIPRRLVRELSERVLADGTAEREVDEEEIAAALDGPLADVEAIAVCLVNSYVDPTHERQVAEAIARRRPDVPVSISADEFPEMGEYERMSTTTVNASLIPVVDTYLSRLEGQIGASGPTLRIMQSNGGLMDSRVARTQPVQMIESGPAAGVLAAARIASENDLPRVLAFDMGGTTAKASAIFDGRPLERPQVEVGAGANLASRFFGGAGHLVRVTSIDIVEVGAGGGSIAWVDTGGALRVGPTGAGADPGPACYGRGGTEPTVTDANVLLGYMSSGAIADGSVPIDRELAERAIVKTVAEPLGLSATEAAYGIVRIANATMIRALRAVSVEKGQDPRDFAIVAFGGAGPVHAAQLAEELGVSTVYIPPFPGIFSAVGLLLAEYRHDVAASFLSPLAELDHADLAAGYRELEDRLATLLESEGIDRDAASFHPEVDLKYNDGEDPLTVARAPLDERLADALASSFADAHREAFGYVSDAPVEVVGLRLRATAQVGTTGLDVLVRDAEAATAAAGPARRSAYFGEAHGFVDVDVRTRADLVGERARGPLLLDEPDTTVVIGPGWTASVDARSNIVLERGEAA